MFRLCGSATVLDLRGDTDCSSLDLCTSALRLRLIGAAVLDLRGDTDRSSRVFDQCTEALPSDIWLLLLLPPLPVLLLLLLLLLLLTCLELPSRFLVPSLPGDWLNMAASAPRSRFSIILAASDKLLDETDKLVLACAC